jgi:hypothetical protein
MRSFADNSMGTGYFVHSNSSRVSSPIFFDEHQSKKRLLPRSHWRDARNVFTFKKFIDRSKKIALRLVAGGRESSPMGVRGHNRKRMAFELFHRLVLLLQQRSFPKSDCGRDLAKLVDLPSI